MKNIYIETNKLFIISLLIVLFFAIGLFLNYNRWINPDEGAHLSDAQLLIMGKVPMVDYNSRQPIYVFILAIFMKIFGISLWGGRMTPLFFTLGNATMIYVITKELFDRRSAQISLFLYLILPYTILFSTVVKMQNIIIFWVLLGIYFYIRYTKSQRLINIIFSGLFFGIAYYIRETGLPILIVVSFLVLIFGNNLKKRLIAFVTIWISYLFIAAIIYIIYSQFFTFKEMQGNYLNPFYQIQINLQKIWSVIFSNYSNPESGSSFRIRGQDPERTILEISLILHFYAYLFIGFFFFIITYIKDNLGKLRRKETTPFYLLIFWLMSLIVSFGYYAVARGFFPCYAIEILPPMVIGLAYLIRFKLLKEKKIRIIFFVGALLYIVVIFSNIFKLAYPDLGFCIMFGIWVAFLIYYFRASSINNLKTFYYLFAILLLFVIFINTQFFSGTILSKLLTASLLIVSLATVYYFMHYFNKIKFARFFSFVVAGFLFGSLLYGYAAFGRKFDMRYYNVWSPKSVINVASILKQEGNEKSIILSGAMIWSLHANMLPFADISHPMAFESEPEDGQVQDAWNKFQNKPPDFVIIDEWTEKCYYAVYSELSEFIMKNYTLIAEDKDSRYPVLIYKKNVIDLQIKS